MTNACDGCIFVLIRILGQQLVRDQLAIGLFADDVGERAAAVEAQRLEEERLDRAALTRVRSSLLAAWFPDVEWVVVYRSDGSSPWFVVHPDGEPDLKLVLRLDDNGGEGEVRLPAASEDAAKVPRWLVRAVGVRAVTDLGRLLLDREREREAEAPLECDP